MSSESDVDIYLRGDAWNAAGLPQIGPIDRAVVHAVAVDGLYRVADITRAVWGDSENRKSCLRILNRMKSYELVALDDGSWRPGHRAPMGQMPRKRVNCPTGSNAPETGQMPRKRVKCPGSGSIDTSRVKCPGNGSNAPETGQLTHHHSDHEDGSIDSKTGHLTRLEGVENTPRHNRERGRALPPVRAEAHAGVVDVLLEKQQQQRPPSPPYSIEALKAGAKLPRSFEGWDLLDLVREIDTEEPPPESDIEAFDLWLGFAANCALWSKLAAGGEVKSLSAYRTGCARRFRRDLEEARDAMASAIAQAVELKKQASKEAEVEAKRAAVLEAASAPALPAPKANDDPKKAPHAWLIGAELPESLRLASLLDSTAPELDDLARRAETLARQADTDWQRGTARISADKPDGWRMAADFHRQRYLTQIKRLVALMPEPQKQEAA